MRPIVWLLALCTVLALPARAVAFDQSHSAWTRLLAAHVVWIDHGHASRVDYAGFLKDRAALQAYLHTLSAVTRGDFDTWSRRQRLAFLINAYNAFTIDLVLTRYPDLASIKDLGSFFTSPWEKTFFTLLGTRRSLDDIEQGMIRAKGAYDEPRIHFALVCASIGCPALRNEAYVAPRLNRQLEDSLRRFLSDHSRNRYDSRSGTLEVSKIFDWYAKDFSQGYDGFTSVKSVFAKYANLLTDDPRAQARIRAGEVPVRFLDYDWRLNDLQRRGKGPGQGPSTALGRRLTDRHPVVDAPQGT